ncbi:hypothetical protein TNIN_471321 [Trichonephila inaurata madagascariensis]|uniref:Uncharacterized protein n=1 Tax=Trichonephila inaurata madagascariensis TaxID=2747483 RepID=A0A8X7CPW6_9ARAC|nr:hypothetical protein TNIN_471321 [Trichonephila inaurata madagascariensis]
MSGLKYQHSRKAVMSRKRNIKFRFRAQHNSPISNPAQRCLMPNLHKTEDVLRSPNINTPSPPELINLFLRLRRFFWFVIVTSDHGVLVIRQERMTVTDGPSLVHFWSSN